MNTRLVESLRTCKTFLRVKEGFTLTIPEPATVAKDPSAIVIFLLLGHGIYVLNFSDECHMLSSSWINDPRAWKDITETLKAWEKGNLPEYAREQTPIGFSNEPKFFFSFSMSS